MGERRADEVYDRVREGKVHIRPWMDCFTEFSEGVGRKQMVIATANPSAMTLDEWAEVFGVSVSGLIELIGSARFLYERKLERELSGGSTGNDSGYYGAEWVIDDQIYS